MEEKGIWSLAALLGKHFVLQAIGISRLIQPVVVIDLLRLRTVRYSRTIVSVDL